MKWRPLSTCLILTLLLAIVAVAVVFSSNATASRQTNAQIAKSEKRERVAFVPGEALVRFKKDRALEGSVQLAVPGDDGAGGGLSIFSSSEEVLVRVERFDGSNIVEGLRIARSAPGDTMKAIAALNARDDVLYAEPNYLRYPDLTPNDPRFVSNELYGLNKIAAPQAWDVGTGSRNVVVAVIDEGIDIIHEDLQANIWTNPSPGSIPGITGDLHGYDFRDNTGTLAPELHATHVAGTIGGVGNNSIGVAGVNWNVSLMSLRFISATGNGNDADALKAYNYVKQMRDLWVSSNGARGANIRVVNASFGGGAFSQSAYDAINAMGQSGVLFVAAAGNDGQDNDSTPHYPSNFNLPNVVSVAATTSGDQIASFSNRGPQTVWLGAPGSGILSTTPGNAYSSLSGTSMATPHVAGAAALLYSLNSNLTPERLRALLAFNGDMSSTFTPGLTISGRRLNVFKSIQAMNEGDTTAPGTVTNFRTGSFAFSSVELIWTASGDDGIAGQASLYQISFVDKITGKETFLANVKPVASGANDNITVPLPYGHTKGTIKLRAFDNVGNEGLPATIPIKLEAMTFDPYRISQSAAAPLSTGGTPLGLTFDDRYLKYDLPFSFSFFTRQGMFPFSSVTVSTNGNLYFFQPAVGPAPPLRTNGDADDVPSSRHQVGQFQMISGMWDDLDLRTSRRADADVYVVPPDSGNPNRIIFRWQGVQFGDGTNGDPINFEIELNRDGTIITRYGAGNINLFPVVGIGGGKQDAYIAESHTSEISPKTLTNAPSVTFLRRTRPDILLSSSNYNVSEGAGHATVTLNRVGDLSAESTVTYSTGDQGSITNCSANSGLALARCDYTTRSGTVVFAANETTKTVDIPLIDDRYLESNETFAFILVTATDAIAGGSANITVLDNDSSSGSNPLGVTGFFVRQQYLDFLSREPDTDGFNFWVNNIDTCGSDVGCREVRRIDTSAAFFLSIEFKETGYLVERLYKVAFGDDTRTSSTGGTHNIMVPIVRLNEFLPDTQRIGEGVIVNQGNWQQQLENNKQAFMEEFVLRTRFLNAFPYSLTAAQFVDKMNDFGKDKNGVKPLSTVERNQLVNALAAGTMTRAQVLRAVAEDGDLVNSEINRAFVLMEYFGYLRRNPNDAPEATLDYAGYEFWLSKLDQFNGNYINAEMVKAFITSIEYGQRFGQ